jgi:hypothetical protein
MGRWRKGTRMFLFGDMPFVPRTVVLCADSDSSRWNEMHPWSREICPRVGNHGTSAESGHAGNCFVELLITTTMTHVDNARMHNDRHLIALQIDGHEIRSS